MVVPPHGRLTVIGAALLWFGWLVSTRDSLATNGIAAVAFATTNTAAAWPIDLGDAEWVCAASRPSWEPPRE